MYLSSAMRDEAPKKILSREALRTYIHSIENDLHPGVNLG